jgi:predicted RNA-binding Zn ribbon-like protein
LGVDSTSHAYGGRLCLALVNTLWWRRSPAPEEQLASYPALVELADAAGWLPERERLLGQAGADPRAGEKALARAIELRERLHTIFSAHAADVRIPEPELRAVTRLGTVALSALDLVITGKGPRLRWTTGTLDLPAQLAAASALALLAGPELERVKQCPGPTCGWVFLDTSRNKSRRWCNSAECGNRARVQAHYQRLRHPTGPG